MDHKLTAAQVRVMKWLALGWVAKPGAGSALLVNGSRVCNVDTMVSLQRAGLASMDADHCWRATDSGLALRNSLVS